MTVKRWKNVKKLGAISFVVFFVFFGFKRKKYEILLFCQAAVIGNCLYRVLSS